MCCWRIVAVARAWARRGRRRGRCASAVRRGAVGASAWWRCWWRWSSLISISSLGLTQTFKSAMGWVKGWALLAVFIVAGAMLQIRAAVVYRATGMLARADAGAGAACSIWPASSACRRISMSRRSASIGGPGPEFFDVTLYAIDDTSGNAAVAVLRALVDGGCVPRRHRVRVRALRALADVAGRRRGRADRRMRRWRDRARRSIALPAIVVLRARDLEYPSARGVRSGWRCRRCRAC